MVKNALAETVGAVLIPGLGSSLGEGMATYTIILAWKIPWAQESGRLWSMELQASWTQLRN